METRLAGGRKPRILHTPVNFAGIAGLLARAQRDLGFDATSVQYSAHNYRFEVDRTLGLDKEGNSLKNAAAVSAFALDAIRSYDVFHFYFGYSLFPFLNPDLALLKSLGKHIVYHYCGCDIRNRAVTLEKYELSGCSECVSLVCLGRKPLPPRYANTIFVSTPDLLEFSPGAVLVPGPIDLARWTPAVPRSGPFTADNPVRVLHAPSDREIKGTKYVVDAIERLKSAGHPVELLMLEGVPHDQVVEFCGQADLAVDQVMIGAYGTVAIEMMAKSVPVVCRIRDDLRRFYPDDLPIVSADPSSLYDKLEALLLSPETWPDLGRAGRAYVEREHEMHRVAALTLSHYGVAPLREAAAPERAATQA